MKELFVTINELLGECPCPVKVACMSGSISCGL